MELATLFFVCGCWHYDRSSLIFQAFHGRREHVQLRHVHLSNHPAATQRHKPLITNTGLVLWYSGGERKAEGRART